MAIKRQQGEDALIASFARFIDGARVKPRGLVLGVGDDAAAVQTEEYDPSDDDITNDTPEPDE